MKKLFAAALAGSMMALSGIALAAVPASQIALGGVAPGASVDSVKQAYGEPSYSYDRERLTFSNGLVVKVDDDRPGVVEEVLVQSGSLGTPAGISVGMGADRLNSAYGTADKVDADRDEVEYVYYSEDRTKQLEFEVRGGVIVKISCELND